MPVPIRLGLLGAGGASFWKIRAIVGVEMVILGMHTGHDGAAALFVDGMLTAYCKEERLTRVKNDGKRLRLNSVNEVLRIAGVKSERVDLLCLSRGHFEMRYYRKTARPMVNLIRGVLGKGRMLASEMSKLGGASEAELVDVERICVDLGLRPDVEVLFANHHYAHVLGAFQFTTWQRDALYLSCDGGGDRAYYSAYSWDGEQLACLYGGDETLLEGTQKDAASIGRAYSVITAHLGFKPIRHEGKITGLAAFGKPVLGEEMAETFIVCEDGAFDSRFTTIGQWREWMKVRAARISREDLAASIQYATEKVVLEWIGKLRKRFPCRYLGLSGGVFSNVRLNQKVAELEGIEEVFVFPAMGDEGLAVGNCTHAMIKRDGIRQLKRYRLSDAYFGYGYDSTTLLKAASRQGLRVIETDTTANTAARLLTEGRIGAIFSQRMEMGPRALGARSIIASPANRSLNDSLNERLNRTEFMPFAPYVLDEDAEKVFLIDDRNREACRFMTITTDVHEQYHDEIPAVVHVDGTARPQIIERETNPLYYDILKQFKALSGIHCLVNTSFNAHEEPIINTPEEAIQALTENRIDFLVTDTGLVFLPER